MLGYSELKYIKECGKGVNYVIVLFMTSFFLPLTTFKENMHLEEESNGIAKLTKCC